MAVTISKQPNNVDFAGNGLPFILQSDKLVVAAGTKANVTFRLSPLIPLDGDTITLYNPDTQKSVLFTFTEFPDNEGYQIGLVDNVGIIEHLSNIVFVKKYYNLTNTGDDDIIITAKNDGFISINFWFAGTGSIAIFSFDDGSDPSYFPYLSKLYAYWLWSDNFIEFSLSLDKAGKAEWMPGKTIVPYTRPDIEEFSLVANSSFEIPEFEFGFAEHIEDPDNDYQTRIDTPVKKRLLSGKVDYRLFPNFTLDSSFRLLIRKNLRVWKDATVIMPYLHLSDVVTDISVVVKLYYTDDTTGEYTANNFTPEQYFAYSLQAGYNALAIDANKEADKEVYKYEVSLQQNSAAVGYSININEIISKAYTARQYLYLNQYGVWEVMHTLGMLDSELTIDRIISRKSDNPDYVKTDSQYSSKTLSSNQTFIDRSGTCKKEEETALMDFAASDEVYLIALGELIPVHITSSNVGLYTESNNLIDIEFTYKLGHDYKG